MASAMTSYPYDLIQHVLSQYHLFLRTYGRCGTIRDMALSNLKVLYVISMKSPEFMGCFILLLVIEVPFTEAYKVCLCI